MAEFKESFRTLLRAVAANSFFRIIFLGLSRAGLLPALVWKRLPVERTFSVKVDAGRHFKYAAIANDTIGRALYWRGLKSYEAETVSVFYQLVQKSRLILDIGANTGLFTLIALAANPEARVIAFEPVPLIFDRLKAHLKMNGWQDRVEVRREAVSNAVGAIKFHVPLGDSPLSSSLHSQGFRGYQGHLIDVPVTTIDEVCPGDIQVDLVKIDVEGFEDKVLEGMQGVLAASAPTLIVENEPDGPYEAVEAILSDFGYRFYHLRREGPVSVKKIRPQEASQYRNFLCTVHDTI